MMIYSFIDYYFGNSMIGFSNNLIYNNGYSSLISNYSISSLYSVNGMISNSAGYCYSVLKSLNFYIIEYNIILLP